ncbi:MAG TPA: hypothetical protein DCM10_17450, partial [Xanthomarina gelatinilytica]|nr:hypothetical protein [Xanthomarina gelatinilytica]
SKFKGLTLSLKLTQTKKVKKVDTLIEFVSHNQQIKTESIQFESLEFAKQLALVQDQLADFRQPINAEGFKLSKKFDIQLSLDGKKWYNSTDELTINGETTPTTTKYCNLGESKSEDQNVRARIDANRAKNIAQTFSIALKNLNKYEKLGLTGKAQSESTTTQLNAIKEEQKLLK